MKTVKAKTLKVWAVHQGDDDRSCGSPRWWFSDQTEANNFAKKRGWFGGDAPVSEHCAMVVPGSVTESGRDEYYLTKAKVDLDGVEEKIQNELKENALAKLSDEEKRVLGLLK